MGADHITRFARVDFHSDKRIFGIKDEDGLLHVYIIGNSGTGKSTLLENMALQDLERGHGFALIDSHGDLVARNAERVNVSMLTTTVDDQEPFSHRRSRATPKRRSTENALAVIRQSVVMARTSTPTVDMLRCLRLIDPKRSRRRNYSA
jgi:adenylate kinase